MPTYLLEVVILGEVCHFNELMGTLENMLNFLVRNRVGAVVWMGFPKKMAKSK